MKYIMFEVGNNKRKIPFIFPVDLNHRRVYEAVKPLLWQNFETAKAISAGEYDPRSGRCSGASESLQLLFNEADSCIIEMYNFTHGIA